MPLMAGILFFGSVGTANHLWQNDVMYDLSDPENPVRWADVQPASGEGFGVSGDVRRERRSRGAASTTAGGRSRRACTSCG